MVIALIMMIVTLYNFSSFTKNMIFSQNKTCNEIKIPLLSRISLASFLWDRIAPDGRHKLWHPIASGAILFAYINFIEK